MQLTTFTDYALRVLMFAGSAGEKLVTVEEVSRVYGVSRAHLVKVVHLLTKEGYLKGFRGRSGGFTLAKPPEEIRLGAIVRLTEPDFNMVECFSTGNKCMIIRSCLIPNAINEALTSFIATLNRYSLADIMLSEYNFMYPDPPTEGTRGPIFGATGVSRSPK
ncbi:RrF2 family transcriptional regulator [Nitratireductor aquibiodomus]|uniref:RrF2 family transcriptional regulator n=1 Tax=Nitratireductor aquibiodomus TaxID=204799 RepID=UPI000468F893|nr:Rrf2 family transcriptional regulator [Nitratireductor aquibiodomus]